MGKEHSSVIINYISVYDQLIILEYVGDGAFVVKILLIRYYIVTFRYIRILFYIIFIWILSGLIVQDYLFDALCHHPFSLGLDYFDVILVFLSLDDLHLLIGNMDSVEVSIGFGGCQITCKSSFDFDVITDDFGLSCLCIQFAYSPHSQVVQVICIQNSLTLTIHLWARSGWVEVKLIHINGHHHCVSVSHVWLAEH